MRIAFFGGTFDPPHRGHLAIAKAAMDRLALDQVMVAPVGTQPLKRESNSTNFADRLNMVRLAFAGEPGFTISLADAPRPDGAPNYTIDVLREIKAALAPGDELFCLLGADSFLTMRRWHRAADLLFVCDFIVAGRPGFSLDDVAAALPDGVRRSCNEAESRRLATCRLSNGGRRSHIHLMPDLEMDISATEIRAAVQGEGSTEDLLAPAVVRFIRKKNLYR